MQEWVACGSIYRVVSVCLRNRMVFRSIMSILYLLSAVSLHAQTYWIKTIFVPGMHDQANAVLPTSDGGFIAAGWVQISDDPDNPDVDGWVVKVDGDGYVQWEKRYGGSGDDEFFDMAATPDGGYVLVGRTNSLNPPGNEYDVWVVKIDADGNVVWTRTFTAADGQSYTDIGWAVEVRSNGQIVIAGLDPEIFGGFLTFVLDASGNFLRRRSVDRCRLGNVFLCQFSTFYDVYDEAFGIWPTSDGGEIAVGCTAQDRYPNTTCDISVWKINANGSVLWGYRAGGTGIDVALDVIQIDNGAYRIVGMTDSFGAGGFDAFLVRLNSNGQAQAPRTYGGPQDEVFYSITQTSDGGYIAAGYTTSFGAGGRDAWVVKLDSGGQILWQKAYGGPSDDVAIFIREVPSGGYIVTGWTMSFGSPGDRNLWLLRLDVNGNIDGETCTLISTTTAVRNTTLDPLGGVFGTRGPVLADFTPVLTPAITSAATDVQCTVADFTLSCNPTLLEIPQGSNGTSTCTVGSVNGFSSPVTLSCSGLPAGATCTFSQNPVTPPKNGSTDVILTVDVSNTVTPAEYNFQVVGTSVIVQSTGTGPPHAVQRSGTIQKSSSEPFGLFEVKALPGRAKTRRILRNAHRSAPQETISIQPTPYAPDEVPEHAPTPQPRSDLTSRVIPQAVTRTHSVNMTLRVVYPTAVRLRDFQAVQDGHTVRLQWATEDETDHLGFRLYRELDGRRVQITPDIIAGRGFMIGFRTRLQAGHTYTWYDRLSSAKGGLPQYWLEAIDTHGNSTWYGPFVPRTGRFTTSRRDAPSLLFSEIRTESRQPSAQTTFSPPVYASPETRSFRRDTPWPLAFLPAIQIEVDQAGWIYISADTLHAMGLPRNVRAQQLQLWADGREIPIQVITDGSRWNGIAFYGFHRDTPWTDRRTFWLTWHGISRYRLRHPTARTLPARTVDDGFPYTIEWRNPVIYWPAYKNGESENWFGPPVLPSGTSLDLTTHHVVRAGPADIVIALQGVTDQPHAVRVELNGQVIGTLTWTGQVPFQARIGLPPGLVREGQNTVRLVAEYNSMDISLIQWIRLTWTHAYTADGAHLWWMSRGAGIYTLRGFSHPDVRVLDITDPYAPRFLPVSVTKHNDMTYDATVLVPDVKPRILYAFTSDATLDPAAMRMQLSSVDWRTIPGSALIILTEPTFADAAARLASWKNGQGLSTIWLDIDHIWNAFSYGAKDPAAIRAFIRWTRTHWHTSPRYLLLIGDASLDPRDYTGAGTTDFIPTPVVETAFMETASDDWYGDMDGDGIPEVVVGRLPATTPAEALTFVSNIIAYEQQPSYGIWPITVVADNNDVVDFEAFSELLADRLSSVTTVDRIYLGQMGLPAAQDALLDQLTGGTSLVHYFGHGSVALWAAEGLLDHNVLSSVSVQGRPIVLATTCLNGYFASVYQDALAETWLRQGAVAVWASSTLTGPLSQAPLARSWIDLYVDKPERLGDLIRVAKQSTDSPDVRRSWILFGDPSMRIR